MNIGAVEDVRAIVDHNRKGRVNETVKDTLGRLVVIDPPYLPWF